MFRSNPIIGRFIQFLMLPNFYLEVIKSSECKKSRLAIVFDLMELFFKYKTFPDNYGPCRLWEVDKAKWKFYYGSNYHPIQRVKLRRKLQREQYHILFNDKSVCEKLCRDTGVLMPYTYGIISPEQNFKERILSWFNNFPIESFIIKPISGRAGRGIILAKRINNSIFIQSPNKLTPLQDFVLEEDSIVQELITQDDRIAVFSSSSVNTIRVVTLLTKEESIIVVSATMRCGLGESYVDNWSAGGVAVGIDCESGKLKKYAYDIKGNRYVEHPTSKIVFESFALPGWISIVDVAEKIQRSFFFYRMLGMDIAINQSGEPVLIEVNANPDLLFQEQTSGPLLQEKQNLRAFGENDLLTNKHQKQLYSKLNCGST